MANIKKKVAVIGAGVIGLSVATHLLERFPNNVQVTLIADRFSPHTISSDKSGGWIFPPLSCASDLYPKDPDKVTEWVRGSFERFKRLHSSEQPTGVCLTYGYLESRSVKSSEEGLPSWAEFVLDFRFILPNDSCKELYKCDKLILGFTTFIVPCPIYLPWLLEQFTGLGGISQERKVNDISELSSHYDIIINCTGLGARELVNDQQVYPVTGHIVSVDAPWIKQWIIRREPVTGKSAYVFPRINELLLGGTFDINSEDMTVDHTTAQSIIDRCCQVVPSLEGAQVKESWVGIRPYRKGGVRLEKEEKENYILIHCYGHGGDGVSLSWGCAEHVGELVEETINTF